MHESVRAVLNAGSLMLLIAGLIDAYSVIVFVAVILSWLQLPPSSQVVRIARMLTDTTNLAAELDVALRSRWQAAWVLLSRFLLVIGRRGDREHPADRLDPVTLTVRVDE